MEIECLTISQINAYINRKLKFDNNLKNVYVKGEISNFKTYPSGHSYFTLKDEKSQIPAVMFIYERDGKYQLYASTMTEDGIGNLHVAFEQLKKKLKAEGLFDDAHKKEIPEYPGKIGVVTAQTGAAIRDIITTIEKRYPYCEVMVFSTLVQGEQAAPQIVRQIEHAQQFDIDTLIVGRGGGSIEDLWPFNEEAVARAIYNCKIPVISAVGHEVDFTISDFVADARAPTPTGAAVMAVPDVNDIKFKIVQLRNRLNKNINDKIMQKRTKLNHVSEKQIFKNPESIYEIKSMTLDNLVTKLEFSSKNIIAENRNKLIELKNKNIMKNPDEILRKKKEPYLRNVDKLTVLNPLLTLKRGYTLTKVEGRVVSSVKDVKSGDKLDVEFDDGTVNTRVI